MMNVSSLLRGVGRALVPVLCSALCAACGASSDHAGATAGASADTSSNAPPSATRDALTSKGFHFVRTEYSFTPNWDVLRKGDRFEDTDGRIAYVTQDSNGNDYVIGPVRPGTYVSAPDNVDPCAGSVADCGVPASGKVTITDLRLDQRGAVIALHGTFEISGVGRTRTGHTIAEGERDVDGACAGPSDEGKTGCGSEGVQSPGRLDPFAIDAGWPLVVLSATGEVERLETDNGHGDDTEVVTFSQFSPAQGG